MTARLRTWAYVTAAMATLARTAAGAGAGDDRPPLPAAIGTGREAVQDVMFLADARPIFIRLRLGAGDRSFRAAWLDAAKAIHAYLDRDTNGTLTPAEAGRGALMPIPKTASFRSRSWPRFSGPRWGLSVSRSAGSPSRATMRCSTISTATRTARSHATSWPPPIRRFAASTSTATS
jgi:hypothetical protein